MPPKSSATQSERSRWHSHRRGQQLGERNPNYLAVPIKTRCLLINEPPIDANRQMNVICGYPLMTFDNGFVLSLIDKSIPILGSTSSYFPFTAQR